MISLGINDGYAATVAALSDGKPVYNGSEERFNAVKNYGGFPEKALAWMQTEVGIGPKDADAIGIAWKSEPFLSTEAFKKSKHRVFDLLTRALPSQLVGSDTLIQNALSISMQRRTALEGLGPKIAPFSKDKVQIFDHHHCHAAASLYGSGLLKKHKEALVITLDGSGDGESMVVWRGTEAGMERLATQNSYHSIGIFIARLTQYMGMKPLEHEYKLMGMAPYGEGSHQSERSLEVFRKYFSLDPSGLKIVNHMGAWGEGMVRRLHQDLFQHRFDGISYAAQQILEELCLPLVLNWIKKTGIPHLAVGGGVFMNIKLNRLLAQHPDVGDFFPMPSCGDESLALGAAYLAGESLKPGSSEPLEHLYLGSSVSEESIASALKGHEAEVAFEKCEDIDTRTAELLADNKVVGRLRGRAEWGARALGNRSILCHPERGQNIHRINKAIKKRDFWMPFCPSILDSFADRYLLNPRDREAKFMNLAFETKPEALNEIVCGLHPFDHTARPQVVSQSYNPAFHKLISHFAELTGIGGVVNTSFNLHGLPIVNSAEDAVHVLLNSEIDYVSIEDTLVWKKS